MQNSLLRTDDYSLIEVVCWIKRAKRLGMNIPLDTRFEKELMEALQVKNHKDLEANLKFLHDETFEAVVERILKRRKKRVMEHREAVGDIYV